MALSTRLSAPSYKIYEPDALDVALSQRVLDPLQGGIAGAMLLNHGLENQAAQQQYLASSDKFNKMAQGLDAMEIAQKHREAAMKIGGQLVEHGEDPTNVQGMEDVFRNPRGSLLPGLLRNKILAETSAAGRAHIPIDKETTSEQQYNPATDTVTTHKYQGAPRQSTPVNNTGSTPMPSSSPATSNAAMQQQIIKRGMAAVGATDPSQVAFGRDGSGGYVVKNLATPNKPAVKFDVTGTQGR